MKEFPFELDEFQKEACECINNGKSVVVCAPTGAGKTVIAEHAIFKAIEEGARIFYTTPLKALSNQKFSDFANKFGNNNVGLLTGDTSINRGAQILVMTTEVFRNMLYGTNFGSVTENLKDVKYVVLDEVHYMNDEQRGTVWEESIIYCPTNIQLIALSATVANADKLTEWINTVHSSTVLVDTDFRPVPLRYFYFDSSKPNDLLPLLTPTGQLNSKIKPEKKLRFKDRKRVQRSVVKDVVRNLHEKEMLPAIYFTFSRKKCDEQMEKCSNLCLVSPKEQKQIREMVDEYLAENPYLNNNKHIDYILNGVASHHAGLLPGWKVLVEKLFQKGLIKVVFATETLAAGINMPARSTVISAVSKRTDSGHRMLTNNEFLQMSGRAGRRGMDKIGYVTIIGTQFQSPEEVFELVTGDSNPLESRFSPSYSMVLNLLYRFSIEDAHSLILKSFGYYTFADRIKPLLRQNSEFSENLDKLNAFKCRDGLTNNNLFDYIKYKNLHIENRKIAKTLKKQAKDKNAPEVVEYEKKSSDFYKKMSSMPCFSCKFYKKHIKQIEVIERLNKKIKSMDKEIDNQKNIYWNNFISRAEILHEFGYLKDNYPTEKGKVCSVLRAENELYLSEIILGNILEGLAPAELASIICAVTTEDIRSESHCYLPVTTTVKKKLGLIKNIRQKLYKAQKDHKIETEMHINSFYSPLIEFWINGEEWEKLIQEVDVNEGDIVRCFKRVIDVVRQITNLEFASDELKENARQAISAIQKEPIDVE